MACTLAPVSEIGDIDRLGSLLEDLSSEQQSIVDQGFGDSFIYEGEQGWNDSWGTSVSDDLPPEPSTTQLKSATQKSRSWLQTSLISLSPMEEVLAIARDEKCVILLKKWPMKESSDIKPYYEVTWSGNLSSDIEDHITCIVCVPLASQQRSSEGNPDWTCIICGFASGYIRIYMTNGTLLLAQFLHDGPVVSIKLKTKESLSLKDFSEQCEELLILYPNALVTIDGFSLYQSLRACRNQLAKAQASLSAEVEPPPLAYRKWRIDDQEKIQDVGGCGITTPCFFDRLQTASYTTGFNAMVKGSAPAFHHFFTAGKVPFIGVYQALEGSSPPIMSEVALAVASKLTSAVLSRLSAAKGWWSGGVQEQPSKEKKIPKVEIGTSLSHRFCLQDKRRHSEKITMAPISHLAVVTDAYNRVLLFDTSKGIVVRMWKGYRDAECGWVVVEEENDECVDTQLDKKHKRIALFLVIYAPKRGIIEIYLTENGNRVGAFNVGKDCKLLYPGYQSLGQTAHSFNFGQSNNNSNQCFLLLSDGTLKSIQVPFHCSLSATHSVRAKDQHLLKKISNLIEKSFNSDNKDSLSKMLTSILLEIQVPSTQKKAIENILGTQRFTPEFLKECLKIFSSQLITKGCDDLEYELEQQDLLQYCRGQQQLVEMFITIENLKELAEGPDSEVNFSKEANAEEEALAELLHIDLSESENILSYIGKYKDVLNTDIAHAEKHKPISPVDITSFLRCFRIIVKDHENSSSSSSTKTCEIGILDNLPKTMSILLGSFLFEDAILGIIPISKLSLALETSRILPKQFIFLLTLYTQSKMCCNIMNLTTIYQLHSLIASLCSLKGGAETDTANLPVNKTSEWWNSIRNVLSDSNEIGNSLIVSIICRSVTIELNLAANKVKKEDDTDILEGNWEPILVDLEEWNYLVSQLENLLEMDCFVHSNHAVTALSGTNSPSFKQHEHNSPNNKNFKSFGKHKHGVLLAGPKTVDRLPVLSVKGILDAGYGAFAEIVSDVLVRQGVPGPCLGPPKPKQFVRDVECSIDGEEDDVPDETLEIQEQLDSHKVLPALVEIRKIFPFSLNHDILWVHCAWESIMIWNEDVEDISMLNTALIHLSCIHNPVSQHGLAVMMWKTVYKESIKAVLGLIEKVGKAPKERLCKQTVNLGYKALIHFLATCKQLIEMLQEIDVVDKNKPGFQTEGLWQRKADSQRSIAEQAAEEPICNLELLNHYWCLVTSLYMIMHSSMKSIKPLSLFDTKGKHAFTQPLNSNPCLSAELDLKVIRNREMFCCNAVTYTINSHITSTCQDDMLRNNTTELLEHLNLIIDLSKAFNTDDDVVRRFIACELYTAGLDIAAQEIAMMVQGKTEFSSQILDVIGQRLAKSLLDGDMIKVSNTLTKLPTKVTSWLERIDRSKLRVANMPLTNTYLLLQYVSSNFAQESKDLSFINELIGSLKRFL